jgi:lysophospholipase L1-like esterase
MRGMTSTPKPPSQRLWSGRLLGLLLGMFLSLPAAELALRAQDAWVGRSATDWLPLRVRGLETSLYKPHPFMGLTLSPNFKPAQPKAAYNYSTNSLGLRGPEVSLEKPAGVKRILCVGGSTTFCTGAHTYQQTWPAQLEQLLNNSGRLSERIEVLNAGVPGYSTAENLNYLALRLLDFKPDIVLFYDAPNDARVIQTRGFQADYSHARRAIPDARPPPLDAFLTRHSRLYARLQAGLENSGQPYQQVSTRSIFYQPDLNQRHVPASTEVVEPGIAAFRRNVRSLTAVARAGGAKVMLQTFSFVRGADLKEGTDFGLTMDRINQVLRDLGQELSIPVAEVAEALSDQARLFDDWMHYNPEGCREHARLVAQALFKHNLLAD